MQNESKNLLTRRQTAKLLSVSLATLDRYTQKTDFPKPIKIGYSVRFIADEVNAYILNLAEKRA